MLQYVNFADSEVLPAVCTWTFPTLGIMQPNQQVHTLQLVSSHMYILCTICIIACIYIAHVYMCMHDLHIYMYRYITVLLLLCTHNVLKFLLGCCALGSEAGSGDSEAVSGAVGCLTGHQDLLSRGESHSGRYHSRLQPTTAL